MGYGHTPRSNRRPAPRRNFTRAPMANKYAGPCETCGRTVLPGEGLLTPDGPGTWTVTHQPSRWTGSPVSGRYIGGCEYYRARAAQDAAYESYRGNIAWSALCDEGERARLAAGYPAGPQCDVTCEVNGHNATCAGGSYAPCPGDCDVTCNVHGPDVDRGPAYMGPSGGGAYRRALPASLARIERQQASGVGMN